MLPKTDLKITDLGMIFRKQIGVSKFSFKYCDCVKNCYDIQLKRLGAIFCCGNKPNFVDAKTIQYSSLSPVKCKIGKKQTFFTQNRPKMDKRSVKQT